MDTLIFFPLTNEPQHMKPDNSDVLILGGGMVGLSIAHQLLERGIYKEHHHRGQGT